MDEHDIERITGCLKRYPVTVAYLFGSEAKGQSGALSDIDIAVYFDRNVDKSERFDLKLRLSVELSAMTKRTADVAVLNDSPPRLSYEIIKSGRVIFCSDRIARVDIETGILSRYLDRRYYDKRHAEITLSKMASGGFQST